MITEGEPVQVLVSREDKIERTARLTENPEAPLEKGQLLGSLSYSVGGDKVVTYTLTAGSSAVKRTFQVCLRYVRDSYFL